MQLIEQSSLNRCMSYFENDPTYKLFKKHSQWDKHEKRDKTNLTESQLIKLALCTGFYFNTARLMVNSEDSYLMVYPEVLISIFVTKQKYRVLWWT